MINPQTWPALQPLDSHNQRLADNVHPTTWSNPTPGGRYNLVVIGAGTAGLVAAAGAAGLGAKVALIERHLMGGDCLNVGCVPSKAIIAAARAAAAVRTAAQFGVRAAPPDVDFGKVMRRMRSLRAHISPHDSAARFRSLGVDVYLGDAAFTGEGMIRVGDQTLQYKKAVIATGARASKLPVPGIEDIEPLTNETLFSLTTLPRRLTVVGGGAIGCEMAQAFARLGSEVTQIEKAGSIMAGEDPEAAAVVQRAMGRDGVSFALDANVVRFERRGGEKVTIHQSGGVESQIVGDEVLVTIGRTPNVDGLGLETVGVDHDVRTGVRVNDRLQTTNQNIYAAGDVASNYKFTHAADFMSRLVIQNALFMGRGRASDLIIPWTTYTSPELGQVGMTAGRAAENGIQFDTYQQPFSGVDRNILEGDCDGFVKIIVRRGTDRILGGTIVGESAGELIAELSMAMTQGIGLKKIASTIHPYPTRADAIRKLGDQYNKSRLTPAVAAAMRQWFTWTR